MSKYMRGIDRMIAESDDVWAAVKTAQWAQRTGLPPGNLWEPGIARKLAALAKEVGRKAAHAHYEFQFFGDEAQDS